MAKEKDKEKVMPEKKFRAGGVVATIWKNKAKDKKGNEVEFFTTGIERSYKDKDDEWQTTSTMRLNDLPKVALVSQKAYEYLVLKEEQDSE